MNTFVFTCGDINGIGPEIVIKCINKISGNSQNKLIFICPGNVFKKTSQFRHPTFKYEISKNRINQIPGVVSILDTGHFKMDTGFPTVASGEASYSAIEKSFQLANQKKVDGIITAPISKTAINLAGYNFPGHTEMYAQWSKVNDYVMMFLSNKMIAALVTIHNPIKKVSSLLSKRRLHTAIKVIYNTSKNDLGISKPKIAILGFNPHAGENGLIGDEEIRIIKPVIEENKFRENLYGPYSPDAFFANRLYKKFDIIVGMYHDQVLIPFKLINFGKGVNYTAGLNLVRTSPDHGVAFDIAGKNAANENSILEAFFYAEKIVKNRKSNVTNIS